MKGILYGDVINTVSKICHRDSNRELGRPDGLLRNSPDLYGILNGLDYDEFNLVKMRKFM